MQKITKAQEEFLTAGDYSGYSLIDISDEFIKIIEQNWCFLPPATVERFCLLKARYEELVEYIDQYTV